jgi:2-polyprenyl-6-methoxyphenol hydroxylase-like FAD-dependent oxidoreductase
MSEHIRADVAIVGGAFAGATMATVLARRGLCVAVLERQERFHDRVRGEWIAPWGVREADRLGVLGDLEDAGGHRVRTLDVVDGLLPDEPPLHVDLATCVRGTDGALALRHEVACEQLLAAARAAGALVYRGVSIDEISTTGAAVVRAGHSTGRLSVEAGIVIGADGGRSLVRRSAGLPFAVQETTLWGSGLLVDGLDAWDDETSLIVSTSCAMSYLIPQGAGRARLYLNLGPDAGPWALGADKAAGLLDQLRQAMPPGVLDLAVPVGPCVIRPFANGRVADVAAARAVLIGDAAGFTNPIAGQGLSMALRDVRLVRDALAGPRGDLTFGRYRREREQRFDRLSAAVALHIEMLASFGRAGEARRTAARLAIGRNPRLAQLALAPFLGPDLISVGTSDVAAAVAAVP